MSFVTFGERESLYDLLADGKLPLTKAMARGDVIQRCLEGRPANLKMFELVINVSGKDVEIVGFREQPQLCFPIKLLVPIVRERLLTYVRVGRVTPGIDLARTLRDRGCEFHLTDQVRVR